MSLKGKSAIVTGGNTGIGKAIVLALAEEGANVCIDYVAMPEAAEELERKVAGLGDQAIGVKADVSKVADLQMLVDETVKAFGRLDVMVNNAGIFTDLHTIVDETEDEYDRTMAVNAKGVWLGCKFAIRQMLTQEPVDGSRGRVVNIASIGGLVGLAAEPAYCAAKGAVVNLTRQLAVDFAPERINVNAVCPGFLQTAMVRPFLADPELNKVLHDKSPWPELGTADDVAKATVFLATNDARWATGTLLTVDGGYTAP
jgi:NAD(P)-dependent dehydrogenase (short-subunit alcohol dehydrogenase family)